MQHFGHLLATFWPHVGRSSTQICLPQFTNCSFDFTLILPYILCSLNPFFYFICWYILIFVLEWARHSAKFHFSFGGRSCVVHQKGGGSCLKRPFASHRMGSSERKLSRLEKVYALRMKGRSSHSLASTSATYRVLLRQLRKRAGYL